MKRFISKRDGSTVYVFKQTAQGGLCGRLEGCTHFSRDPECPPEKLTIFVNSAFRARFVEAVDA